jgi:hypothetical protein
VNKSARVALRFGLAVLAGAGGLFLNERATFLASGSVVTEAQAIIGRPATPMSYAGVARRTTARAVTAGAVAAGAAAAATTTCVQVVDAYGRIVTQCR